MAYEKVGNSTTNLNVKIDFPYPNSVRQKSRGGIFTWMTPIMASVT